jgi:hypothetical protein
MMQTLGLTARPGNDSKGDESFITSDSIKRIYPTLADRGPVHSSFSPSGPVENEDGPVCPGVTPAITLK